MPRIACFGGIYSNYLALEAALADARRRGVDEVYFLGDAGAFGPHPDRALDLLREADVTCLRGNYDDSIGHELPDCQCGYTDPRDNYFARISYDYTLAKTCDEHKAWMRTWPTAIRREFRAGDSGATRAMMCHGSPRRTNEFLWESTTSTQFLDYLADEHQADLILATHTGIKWQRELSRGRRFVNVGVLGRPENDGNTHVWYTLIEFGDRRAEPRAVTTEPRASASGLWMDAAESSRLAETQSVEGGHSHAERRNEARVEFIPIAYDYRRLVREMAAEGLPEEFQRTIVTGWWTTCLEVLPSKERRRGAH